MKGVIVDMSRLLPALIVTFTLVFLTLVRSQTCPTNCKCDQTVDGWRAVCRGGMLRTIMRSLSADFVSLSVSSSNIRTLQASDLQTDVEIPLTNFSITNCRLQNIQDGSFQNLTDLVTLDISSNYIATIREGAFNGLTNLQVLNLSQNNIANVASALQSLHNLHTLDLSYNAISDLHTGAFRSQEQLVYLRLDGNRLQNLHGYVFQGLQNLQHLSLRHCLLISIASDMFSIVRSIRILNLGQNQIKELPASEEFRNLPSLQHLYLDSNQITTLTDSQFSGITLDTLQLSRNQITKITLETFKYFNARVIDLSYNMLVEIQNNFLRPTAPQLEVLNMAGNPLRTVPKFSFHGLYRLKTLNLSNCQLERIEKNQFDNLQNLKELDISLNKLQNVPRAVFASFKKDVLLHLHKNSWHCDCYVKPLKLWLEGHGSDLRTCHRDTLYQDQCMMEKCHSPSSLENIQIKMLEDADLNVCSTDSPSDPLPTNTQLAIVLPCIIIAIFFIILALVLWQRGKTRDELRRQCVKSPSEPVSSHLDFLEQKEHPFDRVSLNESDHNFVFRKYFQTMPSNPDIFIESTSLSHNPSVGGADSVYSSMPSISSGSSNNIGMESTV
ncbi:carboxypeptidase N subunit 2-like isoform X1 [Haliotis rufescens]|uniref:carboxypeptidase N subunit 2-like isoform X1 n=2 Tax=Haliotis rufescens TaxID=6454 RepID=UPI00201EB7DA|nr:carboxypeptidase N subunit 2-like isoform X1 [Haliotis rufescens]